MISNSKTLAFIALTIIASILTSSVNAAAIGPAYLGFAQAQGYRRAAVPIIATTTEEKRFVSGGLLLRNAADDALASLCSTIKANLQAIVRSRTDPNDILLTDNAIFGLSVTCAGTRGPASAQAIDSSPVEQVPNADVPSAQTITDAQNAANADADLATADANADATNALQDVCNTMQEFLTENCRAVNNSNICLVLGSTVNKDCTNAIGATVTSSNNR